MIQAAEAFVHGMKPGDWGESAVGFAEEMLVGSIISYFIYFSDYYIFDSNGGVTFLFENWSL